MNLKKGTLGENAGDDTFKSEETNSGSLEEKQAATPASIEEMFNAKMKELTAEIAELKKIQGQSLQPIPVSGNMNADDIAKISAIVAATLKQMNPKEIDSEAGMEEEQIPADDYVEQGVRFCCPMVGYIVSDDIRKGQRVVLPYKKKEVFFDYVSTRRTRTGKYEQIAPYSAYTSHSKRLTKWLRDHTLYGTLFYETSTEAVNIDVRKAQRMGEVMRLIKNYELPDLLRRCKENNVKPTEDTSIMRTNLAYAIVVREIDKESEYSKTMLEESYKSEKLLGREHQA